MERTADVGVVAPRVLSATDAELAALPGDFERGELPLDRWTHAAHGMVARRFVRSYGPDEALAVMRGALVRDLVARFDRAHAAMPYDEAEALASGEARAAWMPPDLAPFDAAASG